MKWYLITAALISITFSSCSNGEKKEFLTEIEQMESKLDSMKAVANDSTIHFPNQVNISVRNTILKIKNNYTPDTIDYKLAEKINGYKEIRKAVSKNSGNLAKVKQTIPEVEKKLADLKHDIENNVNDREKYQEFINYEQAKVKEIETVLSYYIETTEKYYNRYDSLHPIVNHIGDSLIELKSSKQ